MHHEYLIFNKMERKITEELVNWKNRNDRKPLILLGARQVGKTYILKEFGKREFRQFIYLNCEKELFSKELFRDFNVNRIVLELGRYYETSITPGDTLIVFDEIQTVPNAITSLKYFCEDLPELHVASAGSLLGISLREGESYPVGKVNTLKIYPMSFSEYLLACGRSSLCEMIESLDWDGMKVMDNLLREYLRQYYFTGGMPEAVKTYVETYDVEKVREVQREILDAYSRDFAKHTKPQVARIRQVWNNIPPQLARENKKFIFGAVKKGARASEFEIAIQWLLDAGLIYKVNRVKEPLQPLKFYKDEAAFKLFLLDCGLLACLIEANPNEMLLGSHAFVDFKGAFTENFVLQQMMSAGISSVFYYSKENSTMEIDFLVQAKHGIIPIEVKAEVNVKSKSLNKFVTVDFNRLSFKGLRISMLPYVDQGWMENIPLYATEAFLSRQ